MSKSEADAKRELEAIAPQLVADLAASNYRLRQKVSFFDALAGLALAHKDNAALMLQPGDSGYAWSTRKVPLLFIAPQGDFLVARVRRGFSCRGKICTPNCWPELRGFPAGDIVKKLVNWASAEDAVRVPRARIAVLAAKIPSCSYLQWVLPYV